MTKITEAQVRAAVEASSVALFAFKRPAEQVDVVLGAAWPDVEIPDEAADAALRAAVTASGGEAAVRAALNAAASLMPAPVTKSSPLADLVGTVRRTPDGHLWVAFPHEWRDLSTGNDASDEEMAAMESEVTGEVPGSPAGRRTIRVQWAETAIRRGHDRVKTAVLASGPGVAMFNGHPIAADDLMPLLDATRAVLDPALTELATLTVKDGA